MGKPLDSPPSSLSLSPSKSQSFLNDHSISYTPFWSHTSFSFPAGPVSTLDDPLLIKFCFFLSLFRMGLTNPSRALWRSLLLSTSRKLSTLFGTPLFSTISFRLAFLLALLIGLNLSLRRARVVYQNQKSRSFRVRRDVPQGSALDPVLFSTSMIFLLLWLFPSAALYAHDLVIWSSLLQLRPHKKL